MQFTLDVAHWSARLTIPLKVCPASTKIRPFKMSFKIKLNQIKMGFDVGKVF